MDIDVERRFLDEELRLASLSDLPRAKKVLEDLLAERRSISQQISSSGGDGSLTALDLAMRDARACVEEVDVVAKDREAVTSEVQRCLDETSSMEAKMKELTDRLQPLLRSQHYLQWVNLVSVLSADIASHHGSGNTSPAVVSFHDLLTLQHSAISSLPGASHLHQCLSTHVRHWRHILEALLTKEFEETLKSLGWPFVSGGKELSTIPAEVLTNFRQQIALMMKLRPFSLESASADEVPYPLELMIKPLTKRFRYHFHSKRQTNNINKPEWYLTQVRSWITAHTSFLSRILQPALSECCGGSVPTERLFVRTLLSLVINKLRKDIPQLLTEPAVLSHTIDELLAFSADLTALTPTTATQRQVLLEVLEEDTLLRAWLAVEGMLMNDHQDRVLASPVAWQPRYREVEDIDDARAPECAEAIMTYVHAITERYKNMPSLEPRLLFCRLQLDAIDRYTLHIAKRMEAELSDCTGVMFASLLCAVQYVVDVLADWAEQPFFLSLEERLQEEEQHQQEQLLHQSSTSTTRSTSSRSALPITQFLSSSLSSLSFSSNSSSQQSRSLFAPAIAKLDSIKQKMMEDVVEAVLSEFRLASKPFVQQKWVAFPVSQDLVMREVSDAACDLFVSLRHQLRLAEKRFPKTLFNPIWINLAKQLDQFLLDKVVIVVTLTEGGAQQLQFDLMRNLVPLFSMGTARPERYFPRVKEACQLLMLPAGSAALLRDEMLAAAKENASMAVLDGSSTKSVEKELARMEVKNLSMQQATAVLQRRVDWPQTYS